MGDLQDKVTRELTSRKMGGKPSVSDSSSEDTQLGKEMKMIRNELVKTHMVKSFLGNDSPPVAPVVAQPPAERPSDSLMKAMADVLTTQGKTSGDMVNTLMGRVLDMHQGGGGDSSGKDVLLEFVLGELREMKNRPPVDPIANFTTLLALMQQMEALKGKPAAPPPPPPQTSDASLQLQLKMLEIANAKEERRWSMDREAQQRQWKIEDDLRLAELQLKRVELAQSEKGRENAMGALGDIIGSIMEGMTAAKMGAPAIAANPGARSSPPPPPNVPKFMCPACQTIVAIPSPDVEQVICPGCGAAYDRAPQGTPGAVVNVNSDATTSTPPPPPPPREAINYQMDLTPQEETEDSEAYQGVR